MLIQTNQEKVEFKFPAAFACPTKIGLARTTGCPVSLQLRTYPVRNRGALKISGTFSLRKEVIQPQVLLRLPCYDFTPIMNHTLGRCSPCGSARRLLEIGRAHV